MSKRFLKRAIASICMVMICISMISMSLTSFAASPCTTVNEVVKRIEQLQKDGNLKLDKKKGISYSCWYFCRDLSKELFGHGIGSQQNGQRALCSHDDYITAIPTTKNETTEKIMELLKNTVPGDVIQYHSSNGIHTCTVEKITTTYIRLYEATRPYKKSLNFNYYVGSRMVNFIKTEFEGSKGFGRFDNENYGLTVYRSRLIKPEFLLEIKETMEMQTVSDNVTYRYGPYNASKIVTSLNDGEILNGRIKKTGTKVTVISSFINIHGNKWYRAENGYWIYGERLSSIPSATINVSNSSSKNTKKAVAKGFPAKQLIPVDQDYIIPGPVPVLDGYKFMGYSTTENSNTAQYQIGDSIKISKNLTLFPVWKQTKINMSLDSYTVSVNVPENTYVTKTVGAKCSGNLLLAQKKFTIMSDNPEVATASASDIQYDGYLIFADKLTGNIDINVKKAGSANIIVSLNDYVGNLLISKSIHIDAVTDYKIKYYDNNDGSGAVVQTQTKRSNKQIDLIDYIPQKEGKEFMGWTTEAGSSTVKYGPGDIYNDNASMSLYAVWNDKYEIIHSLSNNVLTISGLGDMASYPTGKTPWAKAYNISSIKEIIIQSGVTSIGSNAFENFYSLDKVTIANSVTKIGNKAFKNCWTLSSINIPLSVKSIGARSFSGCIMLKQLTLPSGAAKIGANRIVAETSGIAIGAFAFENCTSLTTASIPGTVTELGIGAFSGCSALESVDLPNTIDTINDTSFFGCDSLEKIDIPDSVTEIGEVAFSGCSAVEDIVIPEGVQSIGTQAFSGCSSAESAVIPSSADILGAGIFTNCAALDMVTLPEDMEYIGDSMFSGCSALESIDIPDGISYIGDGAFGYCSRLSSIELPETINEISDSAFWGCSSLKTISIPDSVILIGDSAFGQSALESITIPEGVKEIGELAFYSCASLENVSLPASLNFIDNGAFMSCSALSSVDMLEASMSIGEDAFCGCSSLNEIALPEALVSLGANAFGECAAGFSPTCFSTSSVYDQVISTYENTNTIVPVSGVELNEEDLDLTLGEQFDLNETVFPSNATCTDVTWYSDNPEIASVDESGNIVALDGGNATITVTTDDNLLVASCVVNVTVPVSGISLAYNQTEAYIGEEFEMYHSLTPQNPTNIDVTWSSSDENVAVVSENGTVVILGDGIATITATSNDGGFHDSCTVTAKEFIETTGVSISESDLSLTVGESTQLHALVTPSNATSKYVEWMVDESGILSISEEGLVTAEKVGTGTVYVYCVGDGDLVATCTITVKEIRSIAVRTMPNKTEYQYKSNNSFDKTGLTLMVTYSDGSTETLADTSKMTVTGFDTNTSGSKTVTVEYDGQKTTFTVNVKLVWWQWLIKIVLFGWLWY